MAPKKDSASKRGSISTMNGGLARKLRFDSQMEQGEILEWIREAREEQQYSILTFDEVTFDENIVASVIDLFRISSRYGRVWERLNLEFCEGPVDLVINAAMMMECVKHLFLASDRKQEEVMVRLSSTLRINTSLQSLWLLIPVTESCASTLGEALVYNDTLDKLSLSGSNWDVAEEEDDDDDSDSDSDDDSDDDGAVDGEFYNTNRTDTAQSVTAAPLALAKGLAQNRGLRTFDISCCYLHDDAIAAMLGALVGHPHLQILDVSRNHCRERSLQMLGEIVRHEQSGLLSLDLREQTDREPLNLAVFAHSLYNNETLKKLKLSNNQLTDIQITELVRALQGNATLQELDLQWNRITERGLNVLTRHLSDLSALSVLTLGGNAFGKEGKHMLESLPDDDDSICTFNEDNLHQQDHHHHQMSGSRMGGAILGNIREET